MVKEHGDAALSAGLELELRRGVVILGVLSQLMTEQYGYSLKTALSEQGLNMDEGTLYPLLRRLEGQGLLTSTWRVEDSRPRRYYALSPAGKKAYAALAKQWRTLVRAMDGLLK